MGYYATKSNDEFTFYIINDEGKKIKCEVIFTFEYTKTGLKYIVYTDGTLDEKGRTKLYAGSYGKDGEENNNHAQILPIETSEEWELIETKLDEILHIEED